MKVLFITPYKISDGIAYYTKELINAMQKKYNNFAFKVFSWNYLSKITRWINPMFRSKEFIKQSSAVNLVHIQYVASLYLWNLWFLLNLAKLQNPKLKIVFTIHETNDNTPWPWFFNQLQNIYLKLADAVIVHSLYHKKLLPKQFIGKIYVVPHAIPNIIINESIKENSNLILLPGFINRWKGYDIAIKALDVLKQKLPNLKILIVGKAHNTQYTKELKQLVKDLKLDDKVNFKIGFASDQKLNDYFASSNLIILPYKRIAMSGILAQAIAFSKIIIMSDLDPFIEYTQNQGIYFISNNWQDLADKINLLMQNNRLKDTQKNLSKKLKLKYSQSNIVDQTIDLYKKLLNEA